MPVNKNIRSGKAKKSTNAPKHHIPNFLDGEFELPKLEEKVLAFWDGHHIFEKSLEKNLSKRKGAAVKKKFVFYEGPPYANGKPGIHHVLARVVKDVILRYKTMRGYYVPRRAGWDTHGLPVEMAAEKALGFKSKKEIEQYGIEAFNKKAKEQVWLYKDEWENITRRIGYWLDLENAYVTYEPEYIESVWWTLSQIAKRKLLYKGHKVVPWCTRCGTALSSHELAQGYKEVEDNSAYVKFKLKSGQTIGRFKTDDKTYILSWTTTPWTLPGNAALAVGKDIRYRAVQQNGEYFIAAVDRLKDLDLEKGDIADEFTGAQLVAAGLAYEPLFNVSALKSEKSYKIYAADFVTTTEGTGVVHIAAMYGVDDYALGKKIGLPEYHTVDEEGKFTKDIAAGLAGMYVKSKAAEEKIFEHLRARDNLFKIEKYAHEYPHCWRCGTPILYYARTSWFIAMSGLRKELLARNKNINWMPAHVKNGRFGEWLREAKDWNLSRERYWGTPLPIWECKKCGHTAVVEGMDELSCLAGGSKNNYWVMRHGEAESNLFNILNSKGGAFHLTPRGKKQVAAAIKKLKAQLAREHKHIDIVIASDVMRTKETEDIAGEIFTEEKILTDVRLEEIHLGPTIEGYRDKKYSALFPTYASRFEKRPEGGESLRDVRRRVWEFLRDCEKKYEGKNILIVSHEYPIWMLHAVAQGWTERRAILEKEKRETKEKGAFVGFAEIETLDMKTIPRNDGGEVDLHRPYIDDVTLPCSQCGAAMHRVLEVADVWYDSGAMPFAQAHFPFALVPIKNKKSKAKSRAGLDFPADYIAEGMDQTRGWFYTMLAIATAMDRPAPYRNVVSLGLINDKFGQKMSKSKGNIVNPWDVIEKYGIDAVRWYFFTASPLGEPKDFDEQEIAKSFRKTHLIAYNSFIFWKTYAHRTVDKLKAVKSKNILDRWILARLNETISGVAQKLERYEIREAALETGILIDDLSRWYIRRSRRRLQKPESAVDYQAASATMGYVLLGLAKLMAPFTPFFAEMLYAGLGGEKESVHLDEYPASGNKQQATSGKKIAAAMQAVREAAALGLAARAEAGIKVRQPLAKLKVKSRKLKIGKEFLDILADEVNVKEIVFDAKMKNEVELDVVITSALREEGMVREFIRKIQELRQKAALQPKDAIAVALDVPPSVRDAITKNEAFVKTEVGAKMINIGRSDKMNAEEIIKMEGAESWIGIRKI